MNPRKHIFDAVRLSAPSGLFDDAGNVLALDNLLDAFSVPREGAARSIKQEPIFFARIRSSVTGALSQSQVETIKGLLASAAHWPTSWLAYGLATAWHEARLKPIEEIGRGKGRRYGKAGARMKAMPNPPMYGGQIPYGRGLVQLTWCDNYEWADAECAKAGLTKAGEILADFSLVMRPDVSAFILVRGMETGAFTTKKLGDYLPDETATLEGYVSPRRIINGTDRAADIAAYAVQFQAAIQAAVWS
jgi:putative chitinase